MSKNSLRRHHSKRIRDKAKNIYNQSHWWFENFSETEMLLHINKTFENITVCSSRCCGNPRRHWKGKDKITRQELIANINEKEQINEFFKFQG